jgi:tetratricopeptide (TPR) repeat protein
MKRLIIFIYLFGFLTPISFAQDDSFKKGNEAYKKGDYQEAIHYYEKALTGDKHSPQLYYNLGNAYYKTNKIAPSIYYYEKALKLAPKDKDIKNNLALANQMKLDQIENVPQGFSYKLHKSIAHIFSFNTWAIMTVIWSFIGLLAFSLFIFSKKTNIKRVGFAWMFISLFMLLFSWYFAGIAQKIENEKYGIVFVPKTEILSEPNLSSETITQLHEGTKVQILDHKDNWFHIKLPDGKKAWIAQGDVKIIE